VALVGQSELDDVLDNQCLRQLKQREVHHLPLEESRRRHGSVHGRVSGPHQLGFTGDSARYQRDMRQRADAGV
jgi:hypothetical protein